MELIKLLKERGYFNQSTHEVELEELLNKSKISAYIGFDCTAKSLHIGSLIQIMILRYLQKLGHTPIVLLGGGTTKVGDPSGKDESRKLLSTDQIQENIHGIKNTLEKFDLSKTDPNLPPFQFVNNDEWLQDLNYIDFLQEFGRHFSINRMLTFDSVKLRLDRQQSLSFLEFNYMILQAYDFFKLNKDHKCILQIGGSDQWGNIVNGVELTRRINQKEVYGLTTPLLTNSAGQKMGKTANGAIWLDTQMLEEFEYFQYFRNTDDKDVRRFLKLFTELNLDEINNITKQDINEQKKILAFEATKICHGKKAANNCLNKAKAIFEQKSEIPQEEVTFCQTEKQEGKSLSSILKDLNITKSNGESKRLIKGGAVKVNDKKINDEFYLIEFNNNQEKISVGKKRFLKLIKK